VALYDQLLRYVDKKFLDKIYNKVKISPMHSSEYQYPEAIQAVKLQYIYKKLNKYISKQLEKANQLIGA